MKAINFSKTFKDIDNWIVDYNMGKSKKEQIGLPEMVLSKELVKIYSAFLTRATKRSPDAIITHIRTNNAQLAKKLHRSTRSIRRYIIKLMSTGFISDKIFHGSNSSYELAINPSFIVSDSAANVFTATSEIGVKFSDHNSTSSMDCFFDNMKNCPHTEYLSSYTYSSNNNLLIEEKNVENNDFNEKITENQCFTINKFEEKCGKSVDIAQNFVDKEVKLTENQHFVNFSRENKNSLKEFELNKIKKNYSEIFFRSAKMMLWQDSFFTKEVFSVCTSMILKRYNDCYSQKDIIAKNNNLISAVLLSAKYINRSRFSRKNDKKRFAPLPIVYFDPSNKNGIEGAIEWLKLKQSKAKFMMEEIKYEKTMALFKRSIKNKTKGPVDAMRIAEQRLGKLKNKTFLNRFYLEVSNLKSVNYE